MAYLYSSSCIMIAEKNKITSFNRMTEEIDTLELDEPVREIHSDHQETPSFFLLTESGKLYAFGCNYDGELGIGKKEPFVTTPQLIDGESIGKIIQVKSGRVHSVLLNEQGDVYVAGSNMLSQLGRAGDDTPTFEKLNLTKFGRVKLLACGSFFTMAVTEQDLLIAWGHSGYDVFGLDSVYDLATPSPLNLPQDADSILDVVASDHATYVITPTQVYGTYVGELGSNAPNTGTAGLHSIPQLMNQNITRIMQGENFCIAQNNQGRLFGWDKLSQTVEEMEDIKQLPLQSRVIKCAGNEMMVLTQDYQLKFYEVDRIGTINELSLPNNQMKLLLEQAVIDDYRKSCAPLLRTQLYHSFKTKQFVDLLFTPSTKREETTPCDTTLTP
ncbi:RCC1 domain-containing protein [Legionella fallonii]|uniref:Regulator of chromosome condensation, RCC1 n=1 Tax=Legionella fallonii LLAP-10 TaxID=1212491 RepID=A0A098FZE8_9GAMM|nr:hypothetical protein [Legionella fallonii]CEG55592.1 protein of unknown function [Legionella fallonii LLAP-10]